MRSESQWSVAAVTLHAGEAADRHRAELNGLKDIHLQTETVLRHGFSCLNQQPSTLKDASDFLMFALLCQRSRVSPRDNPTVVRPSFGDSGESARTGIDRGWRFSIHTLSGLTPASPQF